MTTKGLFTSGPPKYPQVSPAALLLSPMYLSLSACSRQQTKIPRYAVVAVSRNGNEELKTRGGLLSSEGAKAVVQAERSTPINLFRLLEYSNMLILNNIATPNFIIGVHLHGKRCTHTVHFLNHHQLTSASRDPRNRI